MSVDYYDCDSCWNNWIFSDDIHSCEECWNRICNECFRKENPWIEMTYASDYWEDTVVTADWELNSKYCPICLKTKKENKKNAKKIKIWKTFETEYYWKTVLVEIKEIY